MGGDVMKRLHIFILLGLISFLSSCSQEEITTSTIIDDMINAGFTITKGIDVSRDLFHEEISDSIVTSESINFSNMYTFTDTLTNDYGYIYEIPNDEELVLYYNHLLTYSYYVNDIVFVYKTDHYILEVYQAENSSFPGFVRHYDVEANFQYQLLYDENLVHPKIETLLTSSSEIKYVYDRDELLEHDMSTQIENIDIVALSDVLFEFYAEDGTIEAYAGIFLYKLHNIDDAEKLMDESCSLMLFPASAYTRMVVQYQNYLFIIDHSYFLEYEKVLDALFDDVEYQYFTLYDCMD